MRHQPRPRLVYSHPMLQNNSLGFWRPRDFRETECLRAAEWLQVSDMQWVNCLNGFASFLLPSFIHQIFAHSAISHLFCFRREPSLFKCILWVPRTHAHFQQQSHCPIGYSTAHLLNYIVALECFGSLTLCSEWPLLEDVDFARVSARFWITCPRQLSKKYLWDPLRCFYDAFGEVMRLARLGPTAFHFLPMAVTTSARRMLEMGPLRQQLLSLGNLGNFGNWEELIHLASLVCWFVGLMMGCLLRCLRSCNPI